MKKQVLTLAVGLMAVGANAQEASWYVGGNVGFNSTTNSMKMGNGETVDGARQTSWSLSPEIGTFLTNHIQLGAGITLNGMKTDARTTPINIVKTNQTGATIYSRYFFGKGNFRPFVGVNIYVLPGSQTNTVGTADTKYKIISFGANLNAGFAYGLSDRVTVVGSLGTLGFDKSVKTMDGSDAKVCETNFGLDASSLGNRFNIGVYYTFHK